MEKQITKKTVECFECEGSGRIPVCPEPRYDEWEECPVCEGHGAWVEEFSDAELDKFYPEMTDDEVDLMYEDTGLREAIKEARDTWSYEY